MTVYVFTSVLSVHVMVSVFGPVDQLAALPFVTVVPPLSMAIVAPAVTGAAVTRSLALVVASV